MLIHREYSNPYLAKLIITKDAILTENANKPRMIGYIDLNNYSPFFKNPKIAGFFKEIGLADELGSGIKKIAKYTKIYSGENPVFEDNELFKVIIPTSKTLLEPEYYMGSTELKMLIYEFICSSKGKTRQEINEYVYPKLNDDEKTKSNRIRTAITYLKTKGMIKKLGSYTKPL